MFFNVNVFNDLDELNLNSYRTDSFAIRLLKCF